MARLKSFFSGNEDAYLRVARSRWLRRKYRRGIYLRIPGALSTKKSARPRQDKEKQQAIASALRKSKRNPFRSDVAIRLVLSPSSPNPPSIHRAVKYLLDLLGEPRKYSLLKKKGLLYLDDKQVSYLAVE